MSRGSMAWTPAVTRAPPVDRSLSTTTSNPSAADRSATSYDRSPASSWSVSTVVA